MHCFFNSRKYLPRARDSLFKIFYSLRGSSHETTFESIGDTVYGGIFTWIRTRTFFAKKSEIAPKETVKLYFHIR
jgi:hypothetical protein